ncbi:MAG TPA: hypothetical protein DIV80_03285 [Synergistaceae bacterium]|nr:hypothetical protein [Synergistaceae bacterium]
MLNQTATSFFEREYPLIRLFKHGVDNVIYDAKPHFAFILSDEELALLLDVLNDRTEDRIKEIHSASLSPEKIKNLCLKFRELRRSGVFIKGPLDKISPVDRDGIRDQLKYYEENILLRKFCLEVTENCNFRCTYCKRTIAERSGGHFTTDLSEEKAFLGIRYYFGKYTSFFAGLPGEKKELLLQIVPPGLSWYGGEPFLNFNLIKSTAEYFKALPWDEYSIDTGNLHFTANTNLSIMNDEILHFLVDNQVGLYASLDGPAEEHDKCRVFGDGLGTFETAFSNLLKIKDFDEGYFKKHVSLFGVYTDRHDHKKCTEFNRSLGVSRCEHFPAQYTGVFVTDVEAAIKSYKNSFQESLQNFRARAREESKKQDIDMDLFSGLFAFSNLNVDHPSGKNSMNISITCPMGFDNLMVAANGDFLICHKSDGNMPIGNCDSGLDLEKLIDLNEKYNSSINNRECKNCWAVNFCRICAAARMSPDGFVNPTRRECDFFRLATEFRFACFLSLSEEHPDLLQKITDYRNDPKHYVGVIDKNEFQK